MNSHNDNDLHNLEDQSSENTCENPGFLVCVRVCLCAPVCYHSEDYRPYSDKAAFSELK